MIAARPAAAGAHVAPPSPDALGVAVERIDACGSTNAVLLARVHDGLAAPLALVARRQTAGRGRLGRAWHALPEASLTFSLAWPIVRAPDGLSLAVGCAVADALDPGGRIALKWPNDLWIVDARGPRKLGGVLIETSVAATGPSGPRMAVIGVGLNVRPVDVAGSASFGEIDPEASPDRMLEALLPPLVADLDRFDGGGFAAFRERFTVRDALRGRGVRMERNGDAQTSGIACGVDDDGALVVRRGDGSRARVTSGEVSVRLVPGREIAPC